MIVEGEESLPCVVKDGGKSQATPAPSDRDPKRSMSNPHVVTTLDLDEPRLQRSVPSILYCYHVRILMWMVLGEIPSSPYTLNVPGARRL